MSLKIGWPKKYILICQELSQGEWQELNSIILLSLLVGANMLDFFDELEKLGGGLDSISRVYFSYGDLVCMGS